MTDSPALESVDQWVIEDLEPPSRYTVAPVVWFGGKGNIAAWIARYLEQASVYCEPYCGAATVFWHLPPDAYEVTILNDLNEDLINLLRMLQRSDSFPILSHRLVWTPYSLAEFKRARQILQSDETDPVIRAWAFFVYQNLVFSGDQHGGGWSHAVTASHRGLAEPLSKWQTRLRLLQYWHKRLQSVRLEQRDALQVIQEWDSPETMFYIDPPYHPDMRRGGGYRYETDHEHHVKLVATLLQIKGKAVLSGYDHPVYHPLENAGWRKVQYHTACFAAGRTRFTGIVGTNSARIKVPRTECLWLSPNHSETNTIFGVLT